MAIKSPFLADPAGSITRELNRLGLPTAASIPNTRTRTSHALTIRAGNGQAIGAINSIAPKQTRGIEEEFEINANSRGLPVDLVPQNLTGRSLTVERYDLYTKIMEEVFGTSELFVLTDQRRPFRIREVWRDPSGILSGGQRVYEYIGCYFSDIGRTLSASDDRLVKVAATIVWRDRQRFI